jgi:hypothetical protein
MKPTSILCAILGALFIGAAASAADLKRGGEAYERGDYKTALTEFKTLAGQGDAVAQFHLCDMYLHGKGVAPDFGQAADWCDKAAEAGVPEAQVALAGLKMLGLGTKRNYQDGYFWVIVSAIWSKDELRTAAMNALTQVSRMIGPEDKADIAGDAVRAWRR